MLELYVFANVCLAEMGLLEPNTLWLGLGSDWTQTDRAFSTASRNLHIQIRPLRVQA